MSKKHAFFRVWKAVHIKTFRLILVCEGTTKASALSSSFSAKKKPPFFSISSVKNAVRPIPIKIKDECLTNTRERNINTSGIISGVLLILEYVEPYLISRTRQSIQCRVTLFFLDVTRSNVVLSHY